MLNENKLRGKIAENRMSLSEVASKLSVDPATLHRKLTGASDFSRGEINKLRSILNLTQDDLWEIFFCEGLE